MQLHNTAQVLFKYQHPILHSATDSREIGVGVDGPTPFKPQEPPKSRSKKGPGVAAAKAKLRRA